MTRSSSPTIPLIIEAFDCEMWCPVAQTLFHVTHDTSLRLRSILGLDADEDPGLYNHYDLDDAELASLVAQLGVAFDRSQFESADLEFSLRRCVARDWVPYLIHTEYELPLLLDGRKKLARMEAQMPGQDRFDRWVAEGLLHKEEQYSTPTGGHDEFRWIYYTPKGEEWRIPAMKLVDEAASQAAGWNEYFERLEGMLLGYEKWQNDWWIKIGVLGSGYGGMAFFCPVTAAGLAWIDVAGFRALPPVEGSPLVVAGFDADAEDLQALMSDKPEYVALARFNVLGPHVEDFFEINRGGPWHVPAERISELNRHLRGSVVIVARRDGSG